MKPEIKNPKETKKRLKTERKKMRKAKHFMETGWL